MPCTFLAGMVWYWVPTHGMGLHRYTTYQCRNPVEMGSYEQSSAIHTPPVSAVFETLPFTHLGLVFNILNILEVDHVQGQDFSFSKKRRQRIVFNRRSSFL